MRATQAREYKEMEEMFVYMQASETVWLLIVPSPRVTQNILDVENSPDVVSTWS